MTGLRLDAAQRKHEAAGCIAPIGSERQQARDIALKPTGLPPDKSRNCAMKCIISTGVLNAEWRAGEMQSTPIGTPRAFAISAVTLAPGNTPPWPGLAPCDSLISTILTCRSCACAAKRSTQNEPSSLRQPK